MSCPNGVHIAEMNARARAIIVEQGKIKPITRLRNNLIARTELVGDISQPFIPLVNYALNLPLARWILDASIGIHKNAPLPKYSKQKFTTWFQRRNNERSLSNKKVVYFYGCATQYYEPHVGRAAVRVLEHNGFEVIVPDQNCCGLPLLSNGEFRAARNFHEKNVKNLVKFARQDIPIIGTSTSCTLTLKEEAPDLLGMRDEDTLLVVQNTYDMNEFLLYLHERGELKTDFQPVPLSLAYHIPCQYKAHRIGKPGIDILNLIPDLHLYDSFESCCGIAGTYGYKKEKYDIAMQVGKPLFEFVNKINGPFVVCDSETCRWQITHASGIPAIHPIELLATAYGYDVNDELNKVLMNAI
jgi:glycerol-3-phosphate dehydrogenase subunit C